MQICFLPTSIFSVLDHFFHLFPTVMQSSESPSSQPDSLCSNNSFLFSDDETNVYLLEDRDRHSSQSSLSNRSGYSMNGEQERPGSQWACDGFSDPERTQGNSHAWSASSSISSFLSLSSSSSSGLGSSISESERGKNGGTEGDLLFARKVRIFPPILNSLHLVLTLVSSVPIKCSQLRPVTFYH